MSARPWFSRAFLTGSFVLASVAAATVRAAPRGPARPAGAASRPAATSATRTDATSRPASRPATRPYPSDELAEVCRKAAETLRAKLDKTFSIVVAPPFVVAGNMTQPALQGYAQGSVIQPAAVLWKTYFRKRPEEPITILLFADANSYASWAKKLLGDADVPHFGYYKRTDRTMVMNISTGSGTLVHELTHALIAPDFPEVPDWFNEGLASLHEGCDVRPDRIVGLKNWRLPALLDAIDRKKLRSLADLVTADDFYGEKKGLNYAQARYFCMYAQEKDLLEKLYSQLRDAPSGDRSGGRTGTTAIEAVFGKKIAQVEKDYLAWVKALR
jgi:hypothetical protein